MNILYIALIVLILGGVGFLFFWLKKRSFATSLKNLEDIRLLSVAFPYAGEETKEEETKKETEKMLQLLSLLSNRKGSFIFEIALPNDLSNIQFYIATNQKNVEYIIKSVESLWPEIQIKESSDYNVFNPTGESLGTEVLLEKNFALPLKFLEDFNQDPLSPIVSAFSKLDEKGEGLAYQIILKPAKKGANKFIKKIASKMSQGLSFSQAKKEISFLNQLIKALKETDKKKENNFSEKKEPDQKLIELLNKKASQSLFKINIRFVSSAVSSQKAEAILDNLKSSFSQYNQPNANSFIFKKPSNLIKFFADFSWRRFKQRKSLILSAEEIATLWHPPFLSLKTPELKKVKVKELPPPQELAKEGLIIGKNIFREKETIIKISENDRRRHLYAIGQTGTGKSGFLFNLAKQDILANKGVAVIDPHGDLINDLLSIVPKNRFEDVVLFDPGEIEWPIGLNMLEYDPQKPEQKTFIINELIEIFGQLYNLEQTGGPMFEYYLRNSLMLLMDDPNEKATLVEVPRVFADEEYRHYLLNKCKNSLTYNFWIKEAEKAGGETALANMTPYITSKFNAFLSNDYLRPIIAQRKSSFNFREIIDQKKIFLINLSKGKLGELNSRLLGMIIVGKLFMAALSRVDLPESERKDFYLYIDEFQNVTTKTISQILSEARKYRLNLILAHQFIGQLREDISKAVFGNVGNKVIFRIGAEDAQKIIPQFEPILKVTDFAQLDNYYAYVSLIINGQASLPFNIKTLPPEKGDYSQIESIKVLSQTKYARPRQEVEEDIARRNKS